MRDVHLVKRPEAAIGRLSWREGDTIFHVWIDSDWNLVATTQPRPILYISPHTRDATEDPNRFSVRPLDPTTKENAAMIGKAIQRAKAHGD